MEVFILDENDEKHQVSQFVVLTSEDFLTLTNIKVDVILPSLMDVPPHPQFLIHANLLLLEILKAFDMDRDRKDLLDLAFGMAKWLYESPSEDVLLKDLRLLNLYQTIIRDRELNKEEKNEIHQIITRQQDRPDFLIGAFLLLDLQEEAKQELLKLDEQAQDEFRKLPIFKLFEDR